MLIQSGLDMGPTIRWYEQNYRKLLPRLPRPADDLSGMPPLQNEGRIQLTRSQVAGLLASFPEATRQRSIARGIIGMPPTWFHKDSIGGNPQPTTVVEEALSPTAIIPAYTDYSEWRETGVPNADIRLYEIAAHTNISGEVRRLILSEALLHEFGGHTALATVIYSSRKLRLPEGEVIDGPELLARFAQITHQLPPMSHYSSVYRTEDGNYPSLDAADSNVLRVALDEELAECIAAIRAGFVFCKDDEARCLDPFADRSSVREFVEEVLRATAVE